MKAQIERISHKIRVKEWEVQPTLATAVVHEFEEAHGVFLPESYRAFITEVGNGCSGPPHYGLSPLGKVPIDSPVPSAEHWIVLPDIGKPFPFTRPWVWESGDESDEGVEADVTNGSICLGTDGCGLFWHLIITGPDRGGVCLANCRRWHSATRP
jgi:hypothetical protein